jgi:hypothetical protein
MVLACFHIFMVPTLFWSFNSPTVMSPSKSDFFISIFCIFTSHLIPLSAGGGDNMPVPLLSVGKGLCLRRLRCRVRAGTQIELGCARADGRCRRNCLLLRFAWFSAFFVLCFCWLCVTDFEVRGFSRNVLVVFWYFV